MITVENIEVWGWEHAIRGMRNPMNSWKKSDSHKEAESFVVGDADLDLMRRLFKSGTEHRKYLRQIFVSMDINAPIYWWKEFDTYKIGTVANSCSTMHKIAAKELTLDDFSTEHLDNESLVALKNVIHCMNVNRQSYNVLKDKKYWWQMIQLLPTSYNQRRTVTFNYENVFTMIHQRTGHKLDEWRTFVEVMKTLPYVKEIGEMK